jgi:hypothetical protein
MQKVWILKIGLMLLLIAGACSPIKIINSEPVDNFNLQKYRTFAFYQVETQGDSLSSAYMQKVDLLKKAISTQLAKRGLTPATTQADLLINIGIVVEEKVQTRQTDFRTEAPKYIGQRRYSWKSQEVEVGRYKQGTVTVHLVDSEQNKMVWRGVAQGVISNNINKLERTIDKGAEKLFASIPFPAQQ